jgi:hypothetical protein
VVRVIRTDLLKKIFTESLSGKGARTLASEDVEALFEYAKDTAYRLQHVEAFLIEPQYDRPLMEYTISGPLRETGLGRKADQEEVIQLFRKLNSKAQRNEKFAMRYNVWFTDE